MINKMADESGRKVWVALLFRRKVRVYFIILIFGFCLLSIFALTPATIRAFSRAYPRSLSRLSALPLAPIRTYSRTFPHTSAHADAQISTGA